MKNWEYLCQRISCDQSDLEQQLDKLGKDGWEMVGTGKTRTGFSTTSEVLILFFKRPKQGVPDSPPPKAPAEQSPTDEELSEDRRVRPDWDNAPQPKLENEVPIDPSSKLAEFQPPPPAEGPEIRPDDKSTDTVGGEIFDPTEEPPPAEQLTTPTVAAEIMRGLIRGKDNHIYWEEPLSRARKFIEAVEEKKPPTARTPEPEVIVERRVIGKDGKIKIEGPEPPTPARHADDLDLNDIRRHPMSP